MIDYFISILWLYTHIYGTDLEFHPYYLVVIYILKNVFCAICIIAAVETHFFKWVYAKCDQKTILNTLTLVLIDDTITCKDAGRYFKNGIV